MIILSKWSSLVTRLWGRPISFYVMLIRNTRSHISRRLALISKLRPLMSIMLRLRCRYGTLLDSNGSRPLLKPITREPLVSPSFTPSRTEKPSKILKTGSRKSPKVSPKVSAKSQLETSQTAGIKIDKSHFKKDKNSHKSMESSLYNQVPRIMLISILFSSKLENLSRTNLLKNKKTEKIKAISRLIMTIRRKPPKTANVDPLSHIFLVNHLKQKVVFF